MCLGVPGKIVEVESSRQWAIVETFGVRNKVYIRLVDQDIAAGDYVMVHAGYAIGKMDPGEAHETLTLFEEIARGDEFGKDREHQ